MCINTNCLRTEEEFMLYWRVKVSKFHGMPSWTEIHQIRNVSYKIYLHRKYLILRDSVLRSNSYNLLKRDNTHVSLIYLIFTYREYRLYFRARIGGVGRSRRGERYYFQQTICGKTSIRRRS